MKAKNEHDKRIEKVRKLAKRIFKKEELSIPVDIEKLIKKYAKLTSSDIPFADAICCNHDYSGSKPEIIYNSEKIETRFRFTLAHELGHIKIPWHIGIISCHTDEDDENNEEEIDEDEYRQIENQANVFASELLIPSDWIKEVVQNEDLNKFDKLIEHIQVTANVSFEASLYSILNLLPNDYFIKIEHIDKGYIQYKKSENIDIYNLKYKRENNYEKQYLSEWIKHNIICSGSLFKCSKKISWIKFGETIKDDYLEKLLKSYGQEIDINNLMYTIFDKDKYSLAINIKKVCDNLPKGYIIYIQSSDGMYYGMIKSKETFIYPYSKENSIDEKILWCKENSDGYGECNISEFNIRWYKFDVDYKYFDVENDNRKSTDILKSILDRYEIYGTKRSSVTGSINGTISMQYDRNNYTKEQLYTILKQKFLGRQDLRDIIEDYEFDLYLSKKTKELEQKRLNK